MHGIFKVGFPFFLATLFLNFSFPNAVLAQPQQEEKKENFITYSKNPVVALSEGRPVFLDDLKNAQIHEMMMRLYEMQRSLLKLKVMNSLVETHPELKSHDDPQVTPKRYRRVLLQ